MQWDYAKNGRHLWRFTFSSHILVCIFRKDRGSNLKTAAFTSLMMFPTTTTLPGCSAVLSLSQPLNAAIKPGTNYLSLQITFLRSQSDSQLALTSVACCQLVAK